MKIKLLSLVTLMFFSPLTVLANQIDDINSSNVRLAQTTAASTAATAAAAAATAASSSSGGWSVSSIMNYGLPSGSVTNIIQKVLVWLLSILGLVGVIGFVISGLMYLLSTGNDSMITKAKSGMMYSILGVIVGLAGVVIIQAINVILGGSSTNI